MTPHDARHCPRCIGGTRVPERDGDDLNLLCLCCGDRVLMWRGRYAGYGAELDAVRGHMPPGKKPAAAGGD